MYTPETKHDYGKLLDASLLKLAAYYGQKLVANVSKRRVRNAQSQ